MVCFMYSTCIPVLVQSYIYHHGKVSSFYSILTGCAYSEQESELKCGRPISARKLPANVVLTSSGVNLPIAYQEIRIYFQSCHCCSTHGIIRGKGCFYHCTLFLLELKTYKLGVGEGR